MREARRAFRRVACAMTRASACGSSWLSVESRRVALATIATPSRADAPRRRPVAAVRHATAAEAPATHWAGRQKARAALASATRLMSESDRASFAAYDLLADLARTRAKFVFLSATTARGVKCLCCLCNEGPAAPPTPAMTLSAERHREHRAEKDAEAVGWRGSRRTRRGSRWSRRGE